MKPAICLYCIDVTLKISEEVLNRKCLYNSKMKSKNNYDFKK